MENENEKGMSMFTRPRQSRDVGPSPAGLCLDLCCAAQLVNIPSFLRSSTRRRAPFSRRSSSPPRCAEQRSLEQSPWTASSSCSWASPSSCSAPTSSLSSRRSRRRLPSPTTASAQLRTVRCPTTRRPPTLPYRCLLLLCLLFVQSPS
jgi:hypothetical protein